MDLPYQAGQFLDALGESFAMQGSGAFGIPPMSYGNPVVPHRGPASTSALPDSKTGDTDKLSKTTVLSLIEALNRRTYRGAGEIRWNASAAGSTDSDASSPESSMRGWQSTAARSRRAAPHSLGWVLDTEIGGVRAQVQSLTR